MEAERGREKRKALLGRLKEERLPNLVLDDIERV